MKRIPLFGGNHQQEKEDGVIAINLFQLFEEQLSATAEKQFRLMQLLTSRLVDCQLELNDEEARGTGIGRVMLVWDMNTLFSSQDKPVEKHFNSCLHSISFNFRTTTAGQEEPSQEFLLPRENSSSFSELLENILPSISSLSAGVLAIQVQINTVIIAMILFLC
jgi:hypothetical protein